MNLLENAKLVALLAEDELEDFARHCGIEDEPATREKIAKRVSSLDARRVVDALIAVQRTTLVMMSDVFRILARYEVSLRTTACVLVLPGDGGVIEHTFSRQVLSMLAALSDDWTVEDHGAPFGRIACLVESALVPWVNGVRRNGQVRTRWGINRRAASPAMPYKREQHVSSHIMYEVDAYVPPLRVALARVLAAVGSGPVPPILASIARLVESLEHIQVQWRRAGKLDTNGSRGGVFKDQIEFARPRVRTSGLMLIVELLVKLADTISPGTKTDLVQLSILRDRPRIFELWVMMTSLESYDRLGAKITLNGVADDQRWMLNFSRSSEPVASFSLNGAEFGLYYQWYVPGSMPDIVLRNESDKSNLWVVDPKYSEKRAYKLASYKEVARRYHRTFRPLRSIVAEFFPRDDLRISSPHMLSNEVAIVLDVGPQKSGWASLLSILMSTLPPLNVLAIDISTSHLADAKRKAAAAPSHAWRRALTFGGDRVEDVGTALDQALALTAASNCSKLEPLVSYLEKLHATGARLGDLEIWSDGKFDERDQQPLRDRLRSVCAAVTFETDDIGLQSAHADAP